MGGGIGGGMGFGVGGRDQVYRPGPNTVIAMANANMMSGNHMMGGNRRTMHAHAHAQWQDDSDEDEGWGDDYYDENPGRSQSVRHWCWCWCCRCCCLLSPSFNRFALVSVCCVIC